MVAMSGKTGTGIIFGALFVIASLASCLDNASLDKGADSLSLTDMENCDYEFNTGHYITCEDEGPSLEFVSGPPPAGWLCSRHFSISGTTPLELKILWHPLEDRFGWHFLPGDRLVEEGHSLVTGIMVDVSGDRQEYYWNSPTEEGHVLFPEGSPSPPLDTQSYIYGYYIRGLIPMNTTTSPLSEGDLSIIWGAVEGGWHPTLVADVQEDRYYFPAGQADRRFAAEPYSFNLQGEDFTMNLFTPEIFSALDETVFPLVGANCALNPILPNI